MADPSCSIICAEDKQKYDIGTDEPLPDQAIELLNRLHKLRHSSGRDYQYPMPAGD